MTVIVLLPGMDGSGKLFDDFSLALGLKTIIVSYPPDRVLTYQQMEFVVDSAVSVDEPYIFLGESFSGPIAIGLAAKRSPALEDRVVPAAASELILRFNAHIKVVAVEGPRALLQTNPNACALATREFAHDMRIVI